VSRSPSLVVSPSPFLPNSRETDFMRQTVPHDKASLQEALQNLYKEVDGLSQYFSNAIKHLVSCLVVPYVNSLN
jgi:hypothetical protein